MGDGHMGMAASRQRCAVSEPEDFEGGARATRAMEPLGIHVSAGLHATADRAAAPTSQFSSFSAAPTCQDSCLSTTTNHAAPILNLILGGTGKAGSCLPRDGTKFQQAKAALRAVPTSTLAAARARAAQKIPGQAAARGDARGLEPALR